MKIKLIAVGKLKAGSWRELVHTYQERISGFADFEAVVMKESKKPKKEALKEEAGVILSKIGKNEIPIVLHRTGKLLPTKSFTTLIRKYEQLGREITFIIGSHHGLDDSVISRAKHRISLSALTLSHALTRLVLTEQIYRALTIIKGHPYHRS